MRKQTRNNSSGALNLVVEPKLHFLANVAARYRGKTLAEFVQGAVTVALLPESMLKELLAQHPELSEQYHTEDNDETAVY